MDNNIEIRRVLGKSKLKKTSNQTELEVNEVLSEESKEIVENKLDVAEEDLKSNITEEPIKTNNSEIVEGNIVLDNIEEPIVIEPVVAEAKEGEDKPDTAETEFGIVNETIEEAKKDELIQQEDLKQADEINKIDAVEKEAVSELVDETKETNIIKKETKKLIDKVEKAFVSEKDPVLELIDSSIKSDNTAGFNIKKFIFWSPIVLFIATFLFVQTCVFITNIPVSSNNLQVQASVEEQETKSTVNQENDVKIIENKENEIVLSEKEKQEFINDYKNGLIKRIVPNWHPERESFLIDNNISMTVSIDKNGYTKCSSDFSRDSGQFIVMNRAIDYQYEPLPEWYGEDSLTFKLYFEGNEDLYWRRTTQVKPTYQVSLTPINFTQQENSTVQKIVQPVVKSTKENKKVSNTVKTNQSVEVKKPLKTENVKPQNAVKTDLEKSADYFFE